MSLEGKRVVSLLIEFYIFSKSVSIVLVGFGLISSVITLHGLCDSFVLESLVSTFWDECDLFNSFFLTEYPKGNSRNETSA